MLKKSSPLKLLGKKHVYREKCNGGGIVVFF
jgi:hypothetical protein